MQITNDIKNIGVNDRKITLFEGQYKVENGMAYNSYLVCDDKIAVIDTVDANFGDEWLNNIRLSLGEREPDYLIVQHMEPDHSANIYNFATVYKNAVIVASTKSFSMMKQFFGTEFEERRLVVGEGDTLSLGKHTLTFITAPMIHWPEVIMSYDSYSKVLFCADAFGKFGTTDADEPWTDEARRYYIGIVGKYGAQVQSLLKKAANIDIEILCSLHGPVLSGNIPYYIDLYNKWSSYVPEEEGIAIFYTSIYSNTKKACEILFKKLCDKGINAVIYDLAVCDKAKAVSEAFRYSKAVLAAPSYNAGVFPYMREFIQSLTERNFQNRTVAVIENGTWAPTAAKTIKELLTSAKNIEFTPTTVTIKSALSPESTSQLDMMCEELCKN